MPVRVKESGVAARGHPVITTPRAMAERLDLFRIYLVLRGNIIALDGAAYAVSLM